MTDSTRATRRPRARLGTSVRIGLIVVALALCVVFLVPRGHEIADAFTRQTAVSLLVALVSGALATYATFLSWRALLTGSGHRLPWSGAHRLFFVSQIGKYIPGSVWPIVAQADLGRRHRVPASRSVTVGLLTLLVSCAAGVCVAAATLPFVLSDALRQYWFVALFVPVVLIALHPAVLEKLVQLASRVLRRPLASVRLPPSSVLQALLFAAIAWVLFGLHIATLASPLGLTDPKAALLTTGSYALAWLVGFAIFFLPAGLGGREVVLTSLLVAGSSLDLGDAVSIALASRVLLSVVDVLAVPVTAVLDRRRPARPADEDDTPTEPEESTK